MRDERHWILDPGGHREAMALTLPKTGDDAELFGQPAVWIVLDDGLAPTEWICDLCNSRILTTWGEEPMPVPLIGSAALCADCRAAVEAEEGPWPAQGCQCQACAIWFLIWMREIAVAYNLRIGPPTG